jgi:hypothetical protein
LRAHARGESQENRTGTLVAGHAPSQTELLGQLQGKHCESAPPPAVPSGQGEPARATHPPQRIPIDAHASESHPVNTSPKPRPNASALTRRIAWSPLPAHHSPSLKDPHCHIVSAVPFEEIVLGPQKVPGTGWHCTG